MANEITVSMSLSFLKGGIGSSLSFSDLKFDVSGTDYFQGTQGVAQTADEALNLGHLGTPGWCMIQNTDATNYVTVRFQNDDGDCIKIKAGETACFRFGATAPFVKANTADVQINYLLIED